jgi:MFS family permease
MDDHRLIPEVSTSRLLANKNLRALTIAQFTALVGTYAIYFASMALVEKVTQSSTQVGLMIFSSTLPGFFFGLISGPVVDKRDRATVIKWGCAFRVPIGIFFAFAILVLPQQHWIWVVYVVNFLISALGQFVVSAESSIIPRYVGSNQLMAANSLFNLSSLVAQGVGIVVFAPALLRVGGAGAVGAFSAGLYLLAAVVVLGLPRAAMEAAAESVTRTVRAVLRGLWLDLREGWAFIVRDRSVSLATLQLTLASSAILMIGTIAPGFVTRILKVNFSDAALAIVPIGIGFVAGLWLVSGPQGGKLARETWSIIGLGLFGAGLGAVTALSFFNGNEWLGLGLLMIVAGFGFALTIIPARTVLQERPPVRMRGRVISTQLVLGSAASTVPLPLAGGLADLAGIRTVLGLIAAIVLATAGVSIWGLRGTQIRTTPQEPP